MGDAVETSWCQVSCHWACLVTGCGYSCRTWSCRKCAEPSCGVAISPAGRGVKTLLGPDIRLLKPVSCPYRVRLVRYEEVTVMTGCVGGGYKED